MKKDLLRFFCLLFCFVHLVMYCNAQGTGFVTLKGKQFYDENGQPFFSVGISYVPKIVCDNASNPTSFKVVRDWQIGTTQCLIEPITRYGETASDWANKDPEQSMKDDFAKIKQMGFNTIRLILSPNRRNVVDNLGGFLIPAVEYNNTTNPAFQQCNAMTDNCGMCASAKYIMQLGPNSSQPYNCTNCDAEIFFNLIAHILDIAQSYQLKVIFLVADHPKDPTGASTQYPEMGSSQTDADDFALYLSSLANVLKNKTALLAYEVLSEPNWSINNVNLLDKDKNTVCQYSSEWYDAIKSSDPNHLITTGGTDIGDALTWDQGVMKIDFVTMHLYPFANTALNISAHDSRNTERILNEIAWCSNAWQKPWMINETGLNSYDETNPSETCLAPYVWGSNTDQYNYVSAVLPSLQNCGAIGFSYYMFQDSHQYCIPDVVCSPTCYKCDNWPDPNGPNSSTGPNGGYCGQYNDLDAVKNAINGNYTGLLKYGDPDVATGLYNTSLDKPSVSIVQGYPSNTTSCVAPTINYYNPFQNQTSNSSVHGSVKDANGIAIKDAVIFASTTVFPPSSPSLGIPYIEYTFADAFGNFQINPGQVQNQTSAPIVKDLHVSAVGAERKRSIIFNTLTNYTFNLRKSLHDYDAIINNQTVSGITENFEAFNSVTTSNNVMVLQGFLWVTIFGAKNDTRRFLQNNIGD